MSVQDILMIALAIYLPGSMIAGGYWLLRRAKNKRRSKLLKDVRKNLK